MANRFGFFPAPGTNYRVGDEPEIARRLRRLARALHLHLIGISGYRTPAHSVAVGGFANDPHTRGQASDTPGIEGVSESTLERYGLTRPFSGAREANHIQLLRGGSHAPPRSRRAEGPADWLKDGGWTGSLAHFIPIMVAIGGAESGWRIDAEHQNDDGTFDDGWLQINSSHGFDRHKLRSDPVYTARAAKIVYRKQGLSAWTTYADGRYKAFMGKKPGGSGWSRTRPGGEEPPAAPGDTPDTELAAFWGLPVTPTLINPLDLFKGASKAIGSGTDFLKWISWIFHPLNILRIVEFQVGFPLIAMGMAILVKVWSGGSKERPMKMIGRWVSKSPTPVGRAVKVTRQVSDIRR